MWIGLLFNLGIILALLAILYYVETRLQTISTHKGVSLDMFYSVVHRQNDLADRCNKISDFLVDVDKWINAADADAADAADADADADATKSIEVAESDLVSNGGAVCADETDDYNDNDNESSIESYTDDDSSSDEEYEYDDGGDEEEIANLDIVIDNDGDVKHITTTEPEPALEIMTLDYGDAEGEGDDSDSEDPFAPTVSAIMSEPEPEPEPSLHPTETDNMSVVEDAANNTTDDLKKMSLKQLKGIAKQRNVPNSSHMTKSELLAKLTGADITTIHI